MASSSLSQPTAPPSSPSKRQKLSLQEELVVENDCVDRISDLPDSLLCHILSFLPTTEAVATSILSSRWKTLWTFVPCLYFDLFYLQSSSSFPHIMSRVFDQHKAPYLRKFVLDVDADSDCDPLLVDTWVCAFVSPNLEELVLGYDDDSERMFELPRSIFSCKNLVVLKLSGQIFLSLPSSFNLPSLKILHLFLTHHICLINFDLNDDPDWMLLSGCPVLEDLVLVREGEDYSDKDFVKLEICVPTLKRLEFYIRVDAPEHPNYELEINTPALEFFNFRGDLREVVFLENLPNLVEANVDIDVFDSFDEDEDDFGNMLYHADKVVSLLWELYNVKFLSLSQGATDTESLSFACYHYDVPMFHNLVRLNYEFNCCNWHLLRDLLEKAPNLEVLVVHKVYYRSYEHPPDCVKQPLNIRRVLSPHLTTFHFGGVKGLKDELKFVRCILKKSSVLKKMTLRCRQGNLQNAEEEKSRILKKVSNFPRSSMSCQIAFE